MSVIAVATETGQWLSQPQVPPDAWAETRSPRGPPKYEVWNLGLKSKGTINFYVRLFLFEGDFNLLVWFTKSVFLWLMCWLQGGDGLLCFVFMDTFNLDSLVQFYVFDCFDFILN